MLDEFALIGADVEQIAYLDGIGLADEAVATTLTIPDADLTARSYDVSAEAMSEAGQHFRSHRLARLVQIHTHPGGDGRHSARDDDMAYSQRPGAISIVLPWHGSHRPQPHEAFVHLRTAQGWRLLDAAECRNLVRLVPSFIDCRRQPWSDSPTATRARWRGSWRRWIRRLRPRSN